MKVQEHISKITWSLADKITVITFGFVMFILMTMMETSDFGLWGLLSSLNLWIFQISTSFALLGLIQFGAKRENRPKVDLIAFVLHLSFSLIVAFIIYLSRHFLADIFSEIILIDVAKFLLLLVAVTIPRYYVLKFLQRDYHFKKYFFVNLSYFGTISLIILYYKFTVNNLTFDNVAWMFIIASAFSSFIAVTLIIKKIKFSLSGEITVKEYFKFNIPVSINGLLAATPKNLDVYLAKFFFSSEFVGIYYAAKQLFRVFDEGGYAAGALIYPSSIKLISKNNTEELRKLIIKAASFMFVTYAVMVIILNLGLTELIINLLLPERYFLSISQFNLLSLAALFLPFSLMNIYIIAEGKPALASKYNFFAVIGFITTMIIVGFLKDYNYIPMGLIVFQILLGTQNFIYINKKYKFPFIKIFSAIPDTIKFIKMKFH